MKEITRSLLSCLFSVTPEIKSSTQFTGVFLTLYQKARILQSEIAGFQENRAVTKILSCRVVQLISEKLFSWKDFLVQ